MQELPRDLWPLVPGYGSDDETEHEDSEAKIVSRAKESLQHVVKRLGDDWEELSVLHFKAPLSKLKKEKEKDKEFNKFSNVFTPSFRIEHTEAPVVRDMLLSNGMTATNGRDWLVQWSGPGLRDMAYQEMNEFQRVNHFPGSTELTRKDRLWLNFRDMAETFGSEAFDFMPQTFVLPEQVQEFLELYNQKGGLWIVKPHASSRGRGIFVLRDVAELPLNEVSVVSQYVEDPLLIQGLKFDLRVYVLVTSYEPLRAYVYREGLVRFACRPYSTDAKHLSDAYRHLTNYSINKGSASFVENSEVQADNVGHKWSISALNRHLRCTGIDVDLMWTRIMDVIVKSLLAVEPVIGAKTKAVANHSHNCFELYGFDILVDKELKPWLLEVNLSPSMQADSPLDWQIKSSLLADCFNLVGINRVSKQRLAEATRAKAKVFKIPGKAPGPPERRKRTVVLSRQTVLRNKNCEVDEAEELPSVPLGSLELEELRSTANALLECTRCRNFIRCFPTSRAVRHYAVIVDSQEAMKPWPRGRKPERLTASQVLSSLLFGPAPNHGSVLTSRPRSRAICCRPRPQRSEDRDTEVAQEDAMPRVQGKLVRGRSCTALRRSDVDPVNLLLQDSGCRLAMLEYLIRIHNSCSRLSDLDRAKASRPDVMMRLSSFCSCLGETKEAHVVDRLFETSRAEIARLLKGYGVEDLSMSDGRLSQPSVKSSGGREALEKLHMMTAGELERFLSSSDSPFRALLENYLPGSKSPVRLMRSRSVGRSLVLGPLSELLCLPLSETPTTPEKSRRRVVMKRSPAEALMAAAQLRAGPVELPEKLPESSEQVEMEPEKEKLPESPAKPRELTQACAQIVDVKVRSRSASRSRASSRPVSRRGRTASKTPKSGRSQVSTHRTEEDSLASFVNEMEETKFPTSPSKWSDARRWPPLATDIEL